MSGIDKAHCTRFTIPRADNAIATFILVNAKIENRESQNKEKVFGKKQM